MEEKKKVPVGVKDSSEAETSPVGEISKVVNTKIVVKSKKRKPISGPLVAILLNLILIVATIFLLVNLPGKATDLKTIRNDGLDAKASAKVEVSDLTQPGNIEKIEKINSIFPDESGIVDFVKEIEKLKTGGIVKGITFVSQDAVRDKTTYIGIPFVIEMEGKWADIDTNLQTIQKLPYLQRAITIEVTSKEGGLIAFKYGGFLYVDDSLAKTR